MSVGSGEPRGARIRAKLGHPVVDADGHLIETAPVFKPFFLDYVKDIGGGDMAARFEAAGGMDYDETVLRPWVRSATSSGGPPGRHVRRGGACLPPTALTGPPPTSRV